MLFTFFRWLIPLYRKKPPKTRRPIRNRAFIAGTSELLWIRQAPAMLPSLGAPMAGMRPRAGRCVFVVGEPFVDQFRVQAKNKEEDRAQYKEDSNRASHGILHLSSGRSPCSV